DRDSANRAKTHCQRRHRPSRPGAGALSPLSRKPATAAPTPLHTRSDLTQELVGHSQAMNSVSAPALLLLVVVALATVHAAPRDGPASTECPAGIKAAKAGPAAQGVKYTTKYDNINVDMVLHNERLLNNYMECLMDRRACSKEGQLLKEKQKQIAGTIMSYLLQYKKKYWDELLCKYDPEGNFRKKYEVDEDDEDDEE
ncbi:hypothetical protein FOCC_FOCC000041, partial [Frankliniella occidentalis]